MSFSARRVVIVLAAVALLSLLAASTATAAITASTVQSKMKQIITSKWKCKKLVVKVVPFESDALTRSGRFEAIVFSADSIYHNGVTVAPIYVKSFDVTLDMHQLFSKNNIRTKHRKKTVIKAQISEKDINTLLEMKDMPVENPRIDFSKDKLTLTGKYQAIFGHNLQMEAKLVVEKKRKINLVPTRVTVNGIPLPAGPVRTLLSKVNPLLDLNEVPLTPQIESLKITPKHIELKG